jgi:hypothetical protein
MILKRLLLALALICLLAAAFFWAALNWSYSSGERAGWVQKLSNKGWVCKTWEGELAMVSMPGVAPEKFMFTIRDSAIAEQVTQAMGKRVALHYEEKVGLPTTCFGETRHFVTKVIIADEISLSPGVSVQVPVPPVATSAASAAAPMALPLPAAPALASAPRP